MATPQQPAQFDPGEDSLFLDGQPQQPAPQQSIPATQPQQQATPPSQLPTQPQAADPFAFAAQQAQQQMTPEQTPQVAPVQQQAPQQVAPQSMEQPQQPMATGQTPQQPAPAQPMPMQPVAQPVAAPTFDQIQQQMAVDQPPAEPTVASDSLQTGVDLPADPTAATTATPSTAVPADEIFNQPASGSPSPFDPSTGNTTATPVRQGGIDAAAHEELFGREKIGGGMKIAIVVVVILAFIAIIFGGWYLYSNYVSPVPTALPSQDSSAADTDGDGLSDAEEAELGTNPEVVDTDGDGFSDGEEVRNGFSPLEAPSS